jgi:anhydro-N-acetylmuramic acid kinase
VSKENTYIALGLMSGSSLDGLDLALCQFTISANHRPFTPVASWKLLQAATLTLPDHWIERLKQLPHASAIELAQADHAFGRWLGDQCRTFLLQSEWQPDLIASHGHTIFHDPDSHFTTQIGSGAALAVASRYPVVCDFRSTDVALNGQGAPLAPTADQMLFSDYDYCMNIGGIANISGGNLAYDIGPANQIWNALAQEAGLPFDEDGKLARKGKLIPELLHKVQALPFFEQSPPKSLSNQWVQEVVWPLYQSYPASPEDRLCTAVHQLVEQTQKDLDTWHRPQAGQRLLLTGGGTYHQFFVELLKQRLAVEVIVPESDWIDYKEAMLMALLGVLRWIQQPNVQGSLTGAQVDNCGGAVYLPPLRP